MAALNKAERDRLKAIISDTITLLCRNSIQKFERDFNVEGLIGKILFETTLCYIKLHNLILFNNIN